MFMARGIWQRSILMIARVDSTLLRDVLSQSWLSHLFYLLIKPKKVAFFHKKKSTFFAQIISHWKRCWKIILIAFQLRTSNKRIRSRCQLIKMYWLAVILVTKFFFCPFHDHIFLLHYDFAEISKYLMDLQ